MNKLLITLLVTVAGLLLLMDHAVAHCEIPCGIYDDEMRIEMLLENIVTIEKSMKQIIDHEKEKPRNSNQLVRWVTNKEKHADDLQEIVSQYFMTQRLKPGIKNYQPMLTSLHEMLIYSMKSKQTTDLDHVKKLKELVVVFEGMYFDSK